MESERSIPASIDYTDVLPVAVPAIARRKRFYPQNGTTFNPVGTSEIRIEIGSTNSLLDAQHSYLEFEVSNVSGANLGFDIGGANILFEEVRLEQSGRVLARQQQHNRLHAGIISPTQVSTSGANTDAMVAGGKALFGNAGGNAGMLTPFAAGNGDIYGTALHNQNNQFPNGFTMRMTMAMPTGLFTQNKLIPLPLVAQNAPLTLVLRLGAAADLGVWSGVIAPNAIQVIRANYIAQLIEVGGDVIEQMKQMRDMSGGQLTISGQDIEHNQGVVPLASTGDQIVRVPMRKRSVKSLLFQINSEDFTNGAAGQSAANTYNLSYGGNMNMESFQLKVGSVVYPPTPVQCWGDCLRAATPARGLPVGERGECVMELAKALGSLGFTNPTGRLNTVMYGSNTLAAQVAGASPLSDGDNGDGVNSLAPQSNTQVCVTPFGLDLESFQHTAIESGIDTETMALETNLIMTVANVGAGLENKNVHTYIIYDQHYFFNRDGSVTMSN